MRPIYATYRGFLLSCFLLSSVLSAQNLPNVLPKTPQANTFQVIMPNSSPTATIVRPTTTPYYNPNNNTQKQLQQYEQDRLKVQQEQQYLKNLYKELNNTKTLSYTLLSYANTTGTEHYRNAFAQLQAMNPENFSLKEATFIIENAFYGNTKNFAEFEQIITNSANFITEAIEQQGLDTNDNTVKNLAIYQFITDTLTVGNKTHYPYTYDFNDYMGRINWDNMFVEKLIKTGSGQCNSLPRWYLILAEELHTESYLALAPNHSFIRFKDKSDEWQNAELTSGAIMTDIFMLESGFIKSETVANGNYMVSQTSRQVMAQLLNDLASGYINKYGRDEFVEQVISKSLELNPNGINGNVQQFMYEQERLMYVLYQLQTRDLRQLQPYPQAMDIYKGLVSQDQQLKSLGFETLPREKYEAWLESLEKKKQEQEQTQELNQFKILQPQIKH